MVKLCIPQTLILRFWQSGVVEQLYGPANKKYYFIYIKSITKKQWFIWPKCNIFAIATGFYITQTFAPIVLYSSSI